MHDVICVGWSLKFGKQCCYWGAEETDWWDFTGSESDKGTSSFADRYFIKL